MKKGAGIRNTLDPAITRWQLPPYTPIVYSGWPRYMRSGSSPILNGFNERERRDSHHWREMSTSDERGEWRMQEFQCDVTEV